MASFLTDLAASPALPTLEIVTITTLAFLSGLSFCLSAWIIPLLLLAKPLTATRQFTHVITLGARYLQPSSRILALALLSLALLTSRHPDAFHAKRWQHYAAMMCFLVPVAPYEIVFIFPINDRVKEIGAQVEAAGQGEGGEKEAKELRVLLRQWQVRNFGRILPPLVAAVVGMWSVSGMGR